MTGMTNYTADNFLGYVTGKAAMPTLPTVYAALFTAVGTDAGSGFTEVSAGGYSRAATSSDWGTASGTAPSSILNSTALTFGTASANWGTVIAAGLYDASTSGNLLAFDFIGANPWVPFSCTNASPGVLTAIGITANSTSAGGAAFANGAIVVVTSEYGGYLPTGLVQYTQYTVAGLSADTFNVSTNTTSTGSGLVRCVAAITINAGVGPVSFPISSFTFLAA